MTEMEVLRSRLLAENVARRLNMNVDVVKPAAGRRFISLVNVPDSLTPASFTLTRSGDTYRVTATGDKKAAAPASVKVGEPFTIGAAQRAIQRPASGAL